MINRIDLVKSPTTYFTREESKTVNVLLQKSGSIVSRDDIAQAVWSNKWLEKYSDWQIDRLIYLIRNKLSPLYSIKTVRNSGYMIIKKTTHIPTVKSPTVAGTIPTTSYLEYMNNSRNPRKVLKDLFDVFGPLNIKVKNVLVINSYSFDNVDAISKWLGKNIEVYFINFDERALQLHRNRMEELKLINYHALYDDIRNSKLKDCSFDLVINDFRLNFNTDNKQNIQTMENIHRVLTPKAHAIMSVVIDPRYESTRFGEDQEKAPANKDKPWHFEAQEGLRRNCFTVPYYKRLFNQTGFKIVKEFDVEKGKKWNPPYRRFLLKRV